LKTARLCGKIFFRGEIFNRQVEEVEKVTVRTYESSFSFLNFFTLFDLGCPKGQPDFAVESSLKKEILNRQVEKVLL
jgi:hypothetical protein